MLCLEHQNEHFPRFEDSLILTSLFTENCYFGPGLDAPELEMSLIEYKGDNIR